MIDYMNDIIKCPPRSPRTLATNDDYIHSVKLILKPLDSVLDSFGEWALSKS